MTESIEFEIFKERFESAMSAWRFQVDSYWTRSSYFVVFETAAAAGIWKLIEDKHWWTSLAFSAVLVALTALWFFNNMRLHEYILYWWERAEKVEQSYLESLQKHAETASASIPLVVDYEKNRHQSLKCVSYHCSIQLIPLLFLVGWAWTAGMSIIYLACNIHQLCLCK